MNILLIARTRGRVKRNQGGFTMVELAIVLVIAGIILVAALKGTDMINKAKIERTVSDIRGIQGMVLEHEKRTGHLAGDCDGNGIIDAITGLNVNTLVGAYDTETDPTTGGGTACLPPTAQDKLDTPWKDLRKANIVDPNRVDTVLGRNQTNDYYGIGHLAINSADTNVITVHSIPLWMAKGIDVAIDGSVLDPAKGGSLGRVRLLYDTAEHVDGKDWPTSDANDQMLVSISYQFDVMAPPAAATTP